MTNTEFKETTEKCLTEFGFQKGNDYFLDLDELYIVVKRTKSHYSQSYYLDYGIFVKSRWGDDAYHRKNAYQAEIRCRLGSLENNAHFAIEYEAENANEYRLFLQEQLRKHFSKLKTNGEKNLRKRIRKFPQHFVLNMPPEERKLWSPTWL